MTITTSQERMRETSTFPTQHKPCTTEPPSAAFGAPMAHVGLDLFDYAGKKHLICIDRWSGFPLYKRLTSTSTQSNVLETWFNILGWPANIRSDGGPQFMGPFKRWCAENDIKHELASSYNPQGNGQAEAGVKYVKYLLAKCTKMGEAPQKSLYYWRNISRTDGFFFRRPTATSSIPYQSTWCKWKGYRPPRLD